MVETKENIVIIHTVYTAVDNVRGQLKFQKL